MIIRLRAIAAGLALTAALATVAQASTYSVIYVSPVQGFGGIEYPLVADPSGNLYGSGSKGSGKVFILTPPSGTATSWRSTILYVGGCVPQAIAGCLQNFLLWRDGTLLGTAGGGGAIGGGVIFQITGGLQSTPIALHSFPSKPGDGTGPYSGLVPGLSNLLYGTAGGGGGNDAGTVFSIDPTNPTNYKTLYHFGSAGDGANPSQGNLAVDSQGRLFGETVYGGANGQGTVFALQRTNGDWSEQVIYSFKSTDDVAQPADGVVIDPQGNIYGCGPGGIYGFGAIFKLAPPDAPGGSYTESLIYNFKDRNAIIGENGHLGCALTIDPATLNLIGTAAGGGYTGMGALFELAPPAAGQTEWTYSLIHSFTGTNLDGAYPVAAPVKVGNTYYGGNESGTIYEFTP
jgi:uncharacterized repeat protein (TIGR03803 family)